MQQSVSHLQTKWFGGATGQMHKKNEEKHILVMQTKSFNGNFAKNSNSHPHMLSNDKEDMDVEPFGDPNSAGIAGLDFEGFNMQPGYVGGDGIPEMQLFDLQTQEAIKYLRAGGIMPSTSPVEFRHRTIPPSCLTEDAQAFDLQRQFEEGIRQTRADGVGFLRSPAVSTQLHTPAFVVFDALHSLNSRKPLKEDRGPTTESSHVGPPVIPLDNDVPTTVHDPPFSDFERDGKTRYRCPRAAPRPLVYAI